MVPVSMNVESDDLESGAEAAGNRPDPSENLYRALVPSIKNVIPVPKGKEYAGFYQAKDSDDVRIAKYIAYCRREGIDVNSSIKEFCEKVLVKCQLQNAECLYQEDSENINVENINTDIEMAIKKIEKLKGYFDE